MTMRVHYFFDEEAQRWGFELPPLHIIGGGDATRADARRHALEAIAFALEDPYIAAELQDSAEIVA